MFYWFFFSVHFVLWHFVIFISIRTTSKWKSIFWVPGNWIAFAVWNYTSSTWVLSVASALKGFRDSLISSCNWLIMSCLNSNLSCCPPRLIVEGGDLIVAIFMFQTKFGPFFLYRSFAPHQANTTKQNKKIKFSWFCALFCVDSLILWGRFVVEKITVSIQMCSMKNTALLINNSLILTTAMVNHRRFISIDIHYKDSHYTFKDSIQCNFVFKKVFVVQSKSNAYIIHCIRLIAFQ